MKSWMKYCQAALNRRFLVGLGAIAMVFSLAAYKFDNPVKAAAPAAAAAALDDNSVSALLSLDRAMEALAARVTPATVNVTVVSKKSGVTWNQAGRGDNSGDNNRDDDSNGLQQFFAPFGQQFGRQFGFGQHGFGQQGPQSNIE